MESQRETGGFLPEKQVVTTSSHNLREAFQKEQSQVTKTPGYLKHLSTPLRPLTFGACMLNVIADLTGSKGTQVPDRQRQPSTTYNPHIQSITVPPLTHNFPVIDTVCCPRQRQRR